MVLEAVSSSSSVRVNVKPEVITLARYSEGSVGSVVALAFEAKFHVQLIVPLKEDHRVLSFRKKTATSRCMHYRSKPSIDQ